MIGVVAHDAGGAEIASSYVRRNDLDCAYCLDGPATAIFARKLGPVDSQPLGSLVGSCDWLLCGTSLTSELEWRAIGLAREAGKRSVAMLDHWVNYRLRFVRNGTWAFPDELWVGDEVSARIARQTLPEVESRLIPNAYFEDIRDELAHIAAKPRGEDAGTRLLFTCSPQRDGAEFDALRYFLNNVHCIDDRIEAITLRPHPREEPGKYSWTMDEFDLPIRIDSDVSLTRQIVDTEVVAGVATMAMVVGLLSNKRVVSCIPPEVGITPLPHPEIERLRDLIDARARAEHSA